VPDSGCLTNTLPANDDGSTGQVDLPFAVNFYGTPYSSLYVNNNGNVTFDAPMGTYTPFDINESTPPMIAPFFADVDTRGGGSQVTYGVTTYDGRQAFCVNWVDVGYYNTQSDKTNSFQLLLVDRSDVGPGSFDIVMNYDRVSWETGSASGGSGGFGGTSAGVGYSGGDGKPNHFVQLVGSMQPGSFLDSNSTTGLVNNRYGSGISGRYVFTVLADTDGDGLPDDWETHGLDADGDGHVDVDLPAMGADPRHADVFVRADSMTHLALSDSALQVVEDSFNSAPTSNPDGTTGVHLHVDNGPNSVMNPATGQKWGSLSEADHSIPFTRNLAGQQDNGDFDWTQAFDSIKNERFTGPRRRVFHYALSINRFSAEGFSGISRNMVGTQFVPASDFIIALGSWCEPEGTCLPGRITQAGTFMHELGHNLGLHHGGQDDLNNKPNYLSVMNYNFQTGGLIGAPKTVDYSRFSSSQIPDLDESDLDEPSGFNAATASLAASEKTMYVCNGLSPLQSPMTGPIDFNCSLSDTDTHVQANINGDATQDGTPIFSTLRSYDDWSDLQFKGGAVGGNGSSSLLPGQTTSNEPPAKTLIQLADVVAPPPDLSTGGVDAITPSDATLHGSTHPHGEDVTVTFQYGTDTNYGAETSPTAISNDNQDHSVSAPISGLTAATTYHYRVVARTDRHLLYGADNTFTTPATDQVIQPPVEPPPLQPPIEPPVVTKGPKSKPLSVTASIHGRLLTLTVRCATSAPCKRRTAHLRLGKIKATVHVPRIAGRKKRVLRIKLATRVAGRFRGHKVHVTGLPGITSVQIKRG
jgi:nidogen-like